MTNIYRIVLTVAAVSGLVMLRKGIPQHLKVIAVLLVYAWFNEMSVGYLLKPFHLNSDMPQYNFFMLVEFMAYTYYFMLITGGIMRRIMKCFLYLFPVFWYIAVFYWFKITEWNSFVFTAGGVCMVVWAIHYGYSVVVADAPARLFICSEFWIAAGLAVFYLCALPFMGMFNFLGKTYAHFANQLWYILIIANIIMYSLFTYAFICRMTNTEKFRQ